MKALVSGVSKCLVTRRYMDTLVLEGSEFFRQESNVARMECNEIRGDNQH